MKEKFTSHTSSTFVDGMSNVLIIEQPGEKVDPKAPIHRRDSRTQIIRNLCLSILIQIL